MKLKLLLQLLVGLVILATVVSKVGTTDVWVAVAAVKPENLVVFEAALLGAIVFKAHRWYFLANHVAHVQKSVAAYTYLVGQVVNEVLPVGSGEVTRVYLLKSACENIRANGWRWWPSKGRATSSSS